MSDPTPLILGATAAVGLGLMLRAQLRGVRAAEVAGLVVIAAALLILGWFVFVVFLLVRSI